MMRSTAIVGPLDVSIYVEGLRTRAASLMAIALAVYAALWTLAAVLVDPTPDPKLAIALALGREWQFGYVDMPPLAPWVLEIAYRFGGTVAIYALAPVTVAFAGWLVFAFARRVVGDRHGALAVSLMVGVHPVAFPLGAFDADILQMPLVALAVLAWWRAVHERSRLAWLVFGAAAAILLYAGVSGLFVIAVLMAVSLATAAGRAALRTPDALLGAGAAVYVFALIVTSRLIWLHDHAFAGAVHLPLTQTEAAAAIPALHIAIAVLLGHVGLCLLTFLASPVWARDRAAAPGIPRPPLDRFARTSVIALALLPLPLALAAAAWTGNEFPSSAAAPLLLYSGLLVLVLAHADQALRIHRQRAVAFAAALLLLLPPAAEVAASFAAPWMSGTGRPTNLDTRATGRYISEVYRTRTGRPLEIMIGDAQFASMLALASPDRPHVFFDADRARTFWLGPDEIQTRGALVVWPIAGADAAPPASLAARLPPLVEEAPLTLHWVRPGRLDRLRLGWAIIPPEQ